MNFNYPSSSEIIRNLADVKTRFSVLEQTGKFRIVQFDPPYFGGYELWIVNEKGFLWEPALDLDQALAYLSSEESIEYNTAPD